MECKISNGDIACDSCGRHILLTPDQEVLQSAYIRIAARKGQFFYDRNLGSDIHRLRVDDENFNEKFLFAMREAIVDMPQVTAEIVARRLRRIFIRLTYRSASLEEVIELDDV